MRVEGVSHCNCDEVKKSPVALAVAQARADAKAAGSKVGAAVSAAAHQAKSPVEALPPVGGGGVTSGDSEAGDTGIGLTVSSSDSAVDYLA